MRAQYTHPRPHAKKSSPPTAATQRALPTRMPAMPSRPSSTRPPVTPSRTPSTRAGRPSRPSTSCTLSSAQAEASMASAAKQLPHQALPTGACRHVHRALVPEDRHGPRKVPRVQKKDESETEEDRSRPGRHVPERGSNEVRKESASPEEE